jgi:hypothetical protein
LFWLARHRIHLALFAIGFVGYAAVAGSRLWRQSPDPHFVYQAEAWLRGELSIDEPVKGDDWAKVETVVLDDGSTARGRRLSDRKHFRVAGGDVIPLTRIRQSQGVTHYVSFPPFPAVLMMPPALVGGRRGNDVFVTVVIAALILPLAFACLRRLHQAGLTERAVRDDLLLVAALAFGSVLFFSAVQGKVWYTAHVVGVALALAYAWCSIEGRHPVLAGLALGCAALTRTPMAFMFPLFVLETARVVGGTVALRADRVAFGHALARRLVPFAAPVLALAVIAVVYNTVRFGEPAEFGHTYLDVRQQAQIERHGLFSYQYLARNLAVAFTLMPELPGKAPWVQVSGHGLAIWVTTPLLGLLLWPKQRDAVHRALWLTVAFVAVPTFFYQNSGWLQFGYRFSLDYMPFLILLLAVGGRRFGWGARGLVAIGIAVNLFGAITFDRAWQYYRAGGDAYDVVVRH